MMKLICEMIYLMDVNCKLRIIESAKKHKQFCFWWLARCQSRLQEHDQTSAITLDIGWKECACCNSRSLVQVLSMA